MISELNQHRRDFWAFFAEQLPGLAQRTVRGNEHSRWLHVGHRPLVVAHFVANRSVGVFVRGPAREPVWRVREFLFPHRAFLAERLHNPAIRLGNTFLLPASMRLDMSDRSNWPLAITWLARQSALYEKVFTEIQSGMAAADDTPPIIL